MSARAVVVFGLLTAFIVVLLQGSGMVAVCAAGSVQETVRYDLALGKENGAIAGRVTVSGNPAANAVVFVSSGTGSETAVASSCATGNDGTYSCQNLSAGTYDVRVSGVLGYANQVRYLVGVTADSTTLDVNFAFANGTATISGTVLDPDDEPLPGAAVQAFLKESPGTWAATQTGENGQYAIANMWGGSYLITADYPRLPRMTRDDVPVADTGTTVVNLPGDAGSGAGGTRATCDTVARVSASPAKLAKARIGRNGKVVLKGSIPGVTFAPSVDGMRLVIEDGSGASICAEIPPSKFVRRHQGRMVLYKDSAATVAGVRNIRLRRQSGSGGVNFVIKGKGMALLTGGPGTVIFSLASGDFAARGAAAMKRQGRRYVYP